MMMQGLNKGPRHPYRVDNDITYFGVVNINVDERTIGSVDVWRSATTRQLYCEEKQLGIEAIADTVGMPEIEPGEKWAVLVSRMQKGTDKWKLVRVPRVGRIRHETADEHIIDIDVLDYKVMGDSHWSFLVEDNVNKAVEISREIGN